MGMEPQCPSIPADNLLVLHPDPTMDLDPQYPPTLTAHCALAVSLVASPLVPNPAQTLLPGPSRPHAKRAGDPIPLSAPNSSDSYLCTRQTKYPRVHPQ
jgi:hypothetical protein